MQRLPEADLIYIDGDHTYRGCLNDLRLAEQSTNSMLVDDYESAPVLDRRATPSPVNIQSSSEDISIPE